MYRKALLAGAEGPTHTVEGRVAIAEGKGLEGWATEVKDHMTVIKRGMFFLCVCFLKALSL